MLRRWILIFVVVPSVAILALATSLVWAALHSSSAGGIDCGSSQFSLSQLGPEHAVFTARLVRAAHTGRVDGYWGGDWAIGVVEESFWGLPVWFPHFVLLVNGTYWENTTVLVSGGRAKGILARFLPIVSIRGCGYFSYRMPDAQILLRLLRKPPVSELNCITGYVRSRKPVGGASRSSGKSATVIPPGYSGWPTKAYESLFRGDSDRYTALPGAVVRVTSASGSWDFTTDQDGIYLTSDLPAGAYSVQVLNPPPNQVSPFERVGSRYGARRLGFWTQNLYTQWAGSIEGCVTDRSGKPGFAFLELQNADGTPISSEIMHEGQTSSDGTFRLSGLPMGGRYVLRLNPYGPQEAWPYASLYYPSGTLREQAKVLEIKENQHHVRDLNFRVKPLVERTLPIRVEWPNGRPINDGFFCIIYGQGREETHPQCGGTESDGTAKLPLFGDGPIRVFAYGYVDKDQQLPARYSKAVELEGFSLPRNLKLVVTSADSPY
jgi:hypothetical protein